MSGKAPPPPTPPKAPKVTGGRRNPGRGRPAARPKANTRKQPVSNPTAPPQPGRKQSPPKRASTSSKGKTPSPKRKSTSSKGKTIAVKKQSPPKRTSSSSKGKKISPKRTSSSSKGKRTSVKGVSHTQKKTLWKRIKTRLGFGLNKKTKKSSPKTKKSPPKTKKSPPKRVDFTDEEKAERHRLKLSVEEYQKYKKEQRQKATPKAKGRDPSPIIESWNVLKPAKSRANSVPKARPGTSKPFWAKDVVDLSALPKESNVGGKVLTDAQAAARKTQYKGGGRGIGKGKAPRGRSKSLPLALPMGTPNLKPVPQQINKDDTMEVPGFLRGKLRQVDKVSEYKGNFGTVVSKPKPKPKKK